jgi:ParB family chromosome partitioning protein
MEGLKSKKPVRNVLGRGLSSLISTPVAVHTPDNLARAITPHSFEADAGGAATERAEGRIQYAAIMDVDRGANQPRREFKDTELKELADSIRSLGVLQPVLVRKIGDTNRFEIVAGERRWRAAQIAGLSQLPVIIQDLSDKEALEIGIVENVQRENLNPLEEGAAYQRLIDEFHLTQQDIADRVGKERATIANFTRLLKLPVEVQDYLRRGQISMGHAKAILTVREPNAQVSLARKVLKESLSVRALESIVSRVVVLDGNRSSSSRANQKKAEGAKDQTALVEVIDRMRNALGTKVNLKHHRSGRGRIEIEYFSEQELDRLVETICK